MRIASTLSVLALLSVIACARPAAEPARAASLPATPVSSKVGGCRDVHLYAANDDATQVVIVDVDAHALGLKKGDRRTFDLASAPSGVKVWLDVYMQSAHVDRVHCTKTPTESQMAERYAATSGVLTIELVDNGVVTAAVERAKFAVEGRPVIELEARRFDRVRLTRSAS